MPESGSLRIWLWCQVPRRGMVVNTPGDVAAAGELLAARFRWGAGTVDYTGASTSGEVEDYFFPTLSTSTQGGIDGDANGDGSGRSFGP